jgi:ectoine hydroxylase-related dioxygenase (phytanoyl-CoA dioxygenase family)
MQAIDEQFERDGFAVIPALVEAADLAELRHHYDAVIAGDIACEGDRYLGGLTRQVMTPERHHRYFSDNPAVSAARAMARHLGRSPAMELYFSMLIYKPPQHPHATPWHQDLAYAGQPAAPAGTWRNPRSYLQFWIALDDVDEQMGCMEFLPGVHGRPIPEHVVAAGDPEYEGRLLEVRNVGDCFDLATAVRCPLAAGSATVHGYTTPHYTAPNRTDRQRRAYILSFTGRAQRRQA